MKKIKVIIKRPDEKHGHVTNISDSLKNLQKIVGGPIEIVSLPFPHTVLICNEEGKLRGLPTNFLCGILLKDFIVGDAIICGTDGEDLTDIPIDFQAWKTALKAWGN